MDYITPKQAAEKWGITLRQVQTLCADGKIIGVERLGERTWVIPKDAPKPLDGRTKAVKQAKADNGGNIS
ncbi:transposase [Clostridia bacterium]|nr:transposase [Clostridia bacterium]